MIKKKVDNCILGLLIGFCLMISSVFGLKAGDTIPHTILPSLTNSAQKVDLSKINADYVLIDFWVSWCPICKMLIQEYNTLSKQQSPQHLKIIGINVDDNSNDAKKFLKNHPISFLSLVDSSGNTPKRFGVSAMPTSYLIGPDKKVILVFQGNDENNIKELRKILK